MNKENMLEWANVLESGKYKQYHGGWGNGIDAFCCLNVALKHFTGISHNNKYDPIYQLETILGSELNIDEFYLLIDKFYLFNDEEKLTFPEIAEKIREIVANSNA